MDPNCLFCRIVAGQLPADIVYSDDETIAFNDIAPKAPVHVLVVPREHRRDIVDLAVDPAVSAALVRAIGVTAAKVGLSDFRTIFNTGAGAGQTVFHVHAHVLGGGPIQWP